MARIRITSEGSIYEFEELENSDRVVSVQDFLDKIKKVKAGETVDGVTVIDGSKGSELLDSVNNQNQLEQPESTTSGTVLKVGLFGAIAFLLMKF